MLQNRVDPKGQLIQTRARGLWMGNRGVIHNEQKEIVRPFKLQAWITCLLAFKERKFTIMAPGRWTQLFFMDEATAFAAGHRPCAECRRSDFNRFKEYWLLGNPGYGFTNKTLIREIDAILHLERITANKEKVTFEAGPDQLPDGVFVLIGNNPYLLHKGQLHLWTPFGYTDTMTIPAVKQITVLTPRSVVQAFNAGYIPQVAL